MTFQFDERGHLQPPQPIEVAQKECEQLFVEQMKNSETRHRLWGNFIEFAGRFQREVALEFTVWLDGSFVTQKLNPRDIDAVFLLDYQVCEQKKSVLEHRWFIKENKFSIGLDLYYSIEYPETHKRHFLTHLNHLYWLDVYGHIRKDSVGRQYTKGFIQLKFA